VPQPLCEKEKKGGKIPNLDDQRLKIIHLSTYSALDPFTAECWAKEEIGKEEGKDTNLAHLHPH